MSHVKRGSCLLGLALFTALGFMAFSATGARAISWDISGIEVGSKTPINGRLKAGEEALLLVPAQSLTIHCSGVTFLNNSELVPASNTAHIGLLYSGCTTKVKNETNPGCKPEILFVNIKVKPILHNSEVYLLAEPLTSGQSFTVIHYNEGTCALPVLPAITGSVAFECENGSFVHADCDLAKVTQFIRPVSESLSLTLKDNLTYGLNKATIDGGMEVFLTGILEGKTFNALV